MRVIVYAERIHKYEIEVEADPVNTVGSAVAVARRAIEDETTQGVLSFWDAEQPLDFDVEVME